MRAPEGAAPFTKATYGWGDFDRWVQTGERDVPPQIATTQPFSMEGREISQRMASVIGTIRGEPLPDEDTEPNPGWDAAVSGDRAKATNLPLPHDSVLLMSQMEGAEKQNLEANLKKAVDRILMDTDPSKVISDEEWKEGMGPEPTASQLLDRAELLCQALHIHQDGEQHTEDIRVAWQRVRARFESELEGERAAADAASGSTPVSTQLEVDRQDSAHLAAAHALLQANAQAQDEAREHAEAAHTLAEVGVRGRSKAQAKAAADVRARAQAEEVARQRRAMDSRPLLPAGRTVSTHPPPPPPPPQQSQQPIIPAARPLPPLTRPLLPSRYREYPPSEVPQRPGEPQEGHRNPLFDHLRLPNPETERLHPVRAPMLPHQRHFERPRYPTMEVPPQPPLYDRVLYAPSAPPSSGSGPPHAQYYARQYAHPGQAPPPPPAPPSHPHHQQAAYAPHGSHTHHPPPPPPPPGPGRY